MDKYREIYLVKFSPVGLEKLNDVQRHPEEKMLYEKEQHSKEEQQRKIEAQRKVAYLEQELLKAKAAAGRIE